jgi:hypothetical protein
MARFHRPAGAVVEFGNGAVVVGFRSSATHLVQAVAQRGFFGTEFLDEFIVFKVRAPRAGVMDGFAVGKYGASLIIQGGEFAKEEIVDNGADQVDRIGRAAGQVEGFDPERLAEALVAAGVGFGCRDAAKLEQDPIQTVAAALGTTS